MTMKPDTIPRARGRLEELVREVCDQIEAGRITDEKGRPWTPHRLAKLIDERYPGSGSSPSTGAISDTLKRWSDIGFATIPESPRSFGGFTAEAMSEGLAALKKRYRDANRVAKHKDEAGENPAPVAEEPPIETINQGAPENHGAEELDW